MMQQKLLFFDIDGTLIDFHGKMPLSTIKALEEARKNDHMLILCTGRSKCQIDQKLRDFDFDGMVAASGAYVECRNKKPDVAGENRLKNQRFFINEFIRFANIVPAQGTKVKVLKSKSTKVPESLQTERRARSRTRHKILACHNMSKRHIELLIDYFRQKKISYVFQCTDRLITTPESAVVLKSVYPILHMEEYEDIRAVYQQYHIEKAVCYDPKGRLEETQKALEKYFDVTAMSYKDADTKGAEVMLKGINKAYGMRILEDYLGAGREETIAFGDGPNDLEMMEYAGYSVAMGNALDEVKERADFVTKHVDQDGIYYAMERLGLL